MALTERNGCLESRSTPPNAWSTDLKKSGRARPSSFVAKSRAVLSCKRSREQTWSKQWPERPRLSGRRASGKATGSLPISLIARRRWLPAWRARVWARFGPIHHPSCRAVERLRDCDRSSQRCYWPPPVITTEGNTLIVEKRSVKSFANCLRWSRWSSFPSIQANNSICLNCRSKRRLGPIGSKRQSLSRQSVLSRCHLSIRLGFFIHPERTEFRSRSSIVTEACCWNISKHYRFIWICGRVTAFFGSLPLAG